MTVLPIYSHSDGRLARIIATCDLDIDVESFASAKLTLLRCSSHVKDQSSGQMNYSDSVVNG